MEEEEINKDDINEVVETIKKINPRVWTIIMVICLFFLFYQLGYIVGFREAYTGQKDYYETKMDYYCVCQEERMFNSPLKPIDLSEVVEVK